MPISENFLVDSSKNTINLDASGGIFHIQVAAACESPNTAVCPVSIMTRHLICVNMVMYSKLIFIAK